MVPNQTYEGDQHRRSHWNGKARPAGVKAPAPSPYIRDSRATSVVSPSTSPRGVSHSEPRPVTAGQRHHDGVGVGSESFFDAWGRGCEPRQVCEKQGAARAERARAAFIGHTAARADQPSSAACDIGRGITRPRARHILRGQS